MHGDVVPLAQLRPDDQDAWRCLARELDTRSPYYSLEFAEAVEAVRGGVKVLILSRNGNRAFLPFQLMPYRGAVLRCGEKVGAELSDFFGLIAPKGFSMAGSDLLARARLNAFYFDHLPESDQNIEVGEVEISSGFRLSIGDNAEAYFNRLMATDKHFAKQLQRRERQLVTELGPLRFEWQVNDTTTELNRLIASKVDQFERSGLGNIFATEWKRALIHELAQRRSGECIGVLSTLWAGSTWVASHFALQYKYLLHSWFPVYNYNISKLNPGHILFKNLIAAAPSNGVTAIDFGQGDSQYKRKYLSDTYALRKGIIRRRNMIGFVDHVLQSALWRIGKTA